MKETIGRSVINDAAAVRKRITSNCDLYRTGAAVEDVVPRFAYLLQEAATPVLDTTQLSGIYAEPIRRCGLHYRVARE